MQIICIHSVLMSQVFPDESEYCYCRFKLSVAASGTRECEPASVSASWLGGEQGGVPSKYAHHGPFHDHQTSQLHPIIKNIEYLLYKGQQHYCAFGYQVSLVEQPKLFALRHLCLFLKEEEEEYYFFEFPAQDVNLQNVK